MSIKRRNNIKVRGVGEQVMLFAHGFGCDQNMWRFVSPSFERDFEVVLFDHVGSGGSDLSVYDSAEIRQPDRICRRCRGNRRRTGNQGSSLREATPLQQ